MLISKASPILSVRHTYPVVEGPMRSGTVEFRRLLAGDTIRRSSLLASKI